MATGKQITAAQDALNFILAGNASFTVKSLKTGAHLTYRIRAPREARQGGPSHFVQVRTGGEGRGNWEYLGCIYGAARWAHGRRSFYEANSPESLGFAWMHAALINGRFPRNCELWHEGACGRCGRALTDPVSIDRGIGPECVKKVQTRAFACEAA